MNCAIGISDDENAAIDTRQSCDDEQGFNASSYEACLHTCLACASTSAKVTAHDMAGSTRGHRRSQRHGQPQPQPQSNQQQRQQQRGAAPRTTPTATLSTPTQRAEVNRARASGDVLGAHRAAAPAAEAVDEAADVPDVEGRPPANPYDRSLIRLTVRLTASLQLCGSAPSRPKSQYLHSPADLDEPILQRVPSARHPVRVGGASVHSGRLGRSAAASPSNTESPTLICSVR